MSTLFLGHFLISAQKQYTITLDFDNKKAIEKIQELRKIDEGDYFQVVINNINLNRWKVQVEASDTLLESALSLPFASAVSGIDLTSVLSGLNFTAKSYDTIELVAFKGKDSELTKTNKIIMYQTTALQQAEIVADKLTAIKMSIDSSFFIINREYYASIAADNDFLESPSNFKANDLVNKLFTCLNQLKKLNEMNNSWKAQYDKNIKEHSELISKSPVLKKNNENINGNYGKIKTGVSAVSAAIESKNTNSLMLKLANMRKKPGTYYSMPIQYNGGKKVIQIKISPRDTDVIKDDVYYTKIQLPVKRKNYVAIGQGFFVSELYSEYYSQRLSALNDSVDQFQLVKESTEDFEIGLSALVHFGLNLEDDKKVGLHGFIGPGFSIGQTLNLRLMYGAGVSLGSKHCLSLNLGRTTGFVRRLSAVYNENDFYDKQEDPEVFTISKLKSGLMFSIGYMFKF